ncbi:MAG: hypothetical protein H7321_04955 [Bacteroidia bacterium]|nr:hypothetical protein [Bacteroidia bacterium]
METANTKGEFIKLIFFGNYFYGICAVALTIEATLQQHYPLNDVFYFLAVFASATLYYIKAYISESTTNTINPRLIWYNTRRKTVIASRFILNLILAVSIGSILYKYDISGILTMTLSEWLIALIFPFVAILYYGINSKSMRQYNLRNIGWLKPFVIAFTWAGLINVYPLLYYNITHKTTLNIDFLNILLFVKNFMFIAVLCIMFDIKDYAMDYNHKLKTFVVHVGLRKTIHNIIIPLTSLGIASFITFAISMHFSIEKIMLNMIPFIAMISVAYALHRRKSIFYYLIIIDGLMLLKGICGTVAMVWF